MAEKAIEKGFRYYDPKNKSIVYVLHNGMGSGKHLLLPTAPEIWITQNDLYKEQTITKTFYSTRLI